MIHLTKALIRRWLDTLLHIDDTPERTAAAFALGVFFGFSPFLGFHTLLGIVVAFLFDLNRVAVLLGVYSNLPWIIAPYYAHRHDGSARRSPATLPPGSRRSSGRCSSCRSFDGEFWHQLITILKPLLWPYTVGSTDRRRDHGGDCVSAGPGIRDKSPPSS